MIPFFNFLIYSNFYISFGAALLSLYYAFILETNFFISTPLFILAGTYISYFCIRIMGQKNYPHSTSQFVDWFKKYKSFQYFMLLVMLFILGYSFFDLNSLQIISFVCAFVLVFIYEKSPLLNFSLRKLKLLKPFVIALCWSLVCVVPMMESLTIPNLFYFLEFFIFILLLSIPFDYKDKQVDIQNGITTFAHILTNKALLRTLPVLFSLYLIFSFYLLRTPIMLLFLMLIFYSIGLRQIHRTLLFNYMIDGIIILKGCAIFYL